MLSYFVGSHFLANAWHKDAILAGQYDAVQLGQTMAFLTLSMAEIFHSFNMRSLKGSLFGLKSMNYWLIGAGVLSLLLTTAVIEIPFLANAFSLVNLSFAEYGIALALAVTVLPFVEMVKFILSRFGKKKG